MTTMTGWRGVFGAAGEVWLPVFLDVSLKGALLLAGAALAVLLLRKSSSAVRHLVWSLGLGALLLLPGLRVATPAWRVEATLGSESLLTLLAVGAEPQKGPWAGPGSTGVEPTREDLTPDRRDPSDRGAAENAAFPRRLGGKSGPGGEPVSPPGGAGTTGMSAPEALPGASRWGAGDWPEVLLALWMAGVVVLGGRVALGFLRVRRLARAGEEARDPVLRARLEGVARRLNLPRRVRLLVAPGTPIPMTWGALRPVLLLPAGARSWSPRRLEHVLLHELAHVKRWDHPAQLLAEVAAVLHWMNPLAWLAVSRVRIERERACDDLVVSAGCRPSGYARDLLEVARSLRGRPGEALVAVPMARPSSLGERVRAILDPRRPRGGPGRAGATLAGAVALALAVPLAAFSPAPSLAAGPPSELGTSGSKGVEPGVETRAQSRELCVFRGSGPQSTQVNVDDDRARIRWSTDDCSVEVEIRGEVQFGSDDRSVTRVPPAGLFELREEVGRSRRRVRMESGDARAPRVEYWVDGDRAVFDDEAREWLAALLPEVFRHTTINSEARARRILEQEGVEGLLREIQRIESDHVARTYFEHLLAGAELDEAEMRQVFRIAAERLDSDHHLAELLLAVVEARGLDRGVRGAYLEAAGAIDSDHHARRVLERLLEEPRLDGPTLEGVLLASRNLDSDHHLAELLLKTVQLGELDGPGRAAFLSALEGIDSDHHHRRVLEGFLDTGPLSASELAHILELTRGIDSDHHLAEILIRVGRGHPLDAEARDAYLRAAARIDSDQHLRRTLEALLEAPQLEERHVAVALDLAAGIDSDHHLAEVLVRIAGLPVPLRGALRDAYVRAAEGIGSRTHRDRALAALARAGAI